MNINSKKIIKTVITLVIALWVISKISFAQNINQQITAQIYKDGNIVGETTVTIDGEKSNYILTDNEWFNGKFYIHEFEKTGRDKVVAGIRWDEDNVSRIRYIGSGMFIDIDIEKTIAVSDKMTEFAIMCIDGRVIATSEEAYETFVNHVSYDNGTARVWYENKFPKLKDK